MPADPDTTLEPGQVAVVRRAIMYCRVTNRQLADYESLLSKLVSDEVLEKRDRWRIQNILNAYKRDRLEAKERRLVGWICSDLWDAHRAPADY